MSQEFINPSDGVIRQYLATSKTLAVVGLSDREETTSNRVTKEMQARGYKIIPVNPKVAGGEILGEKAYASLAEIPFPVDIVNVYRRSEFLPDVARELYDYFCAQSAARIATQTGEFAADMQVSLVNDGPVTFWLQVS